MASETSDKICSVENCTATGWIRRGLCGAHYERLKRYGDVHAERPVARYQRQGLICKVDGCDRPTKQRNLCGAHAWRLRTKGDVLAHMPVKPKRPKGTGWTDANGYRRIRDEREHRLVMATLLGRALADDEHVHHRNGNRADNRPENLELWVVRRQPPGQRVSERISDAVATLRRYAPELLASECQTSTDSSGSPGFAG